MIVIWKAKYMHKYIIASSLNAHGVAATKHFYHLLHILVMESKHLL